MLPYWMIFPIGSSLGHFSFASDALITPTCGASGPSRSSKTRPRRTGMFIAVKYPGPATRNSASPLRAGSLMSADSRDISSCSSGRLMMMNVPLA